MKTSAALLAGALTATCFTSAAHADDSVNFLVLSENGLGTSRQAQPYVDKLVALAAKKNGWASADGKYVTRRSAAKRYISKTSPEFGIVSLGAFLALRKRHGLEVVGTAEVRGAGGARYHLISKDATNLAGCKGKKLASNHFGDKRFIERVVAGGAFSLSQFTAKKMRRPVQPIKAVARGKAACALVDAAQLAELRHIKGTGGIKSVWKSSALPPMAVVGFKNASAAQKSKFKSTLGSLCTGSGKASCDKVGIVALKASGDAPYRSVISAYGN